MTKYFLYIIFLFPIVTYSQVVTTDPTFPKANQPLKITVDVTGTSLADFAGDVYIWTWVERGSVDINAPTNVNPATAAQNAAKCIKTASNTYEITLSPTALDFYKPNFTGVSGDLDKIGFLLKEGASFDKKTGDLSITFAQGFALSLTSPTQPLIFLNQGAPLTITANASEAADITIKVNNIVVATQLASTSIDYIHTVTESSGSSTVLIEAFNGSETKSISFVYNIRTSVVNQTRPNGVIDGINYTADPTHVILSLWAPLKSSAYVFGDFTNWQVLSAYQMKKDGEHFWIELSSLVPGEEYAFQYLVDESIRVADPYSDKILDLDDQFIPSATYADLKPFPSAALSTKWYENKLSVLQTNQAPFVWETTDFQKPSKEDLVVYELLVRDFFADGQRNYQNLIDTISYIKRLGANAIELMPVMEFGGNDSWGYNPTFMFAPDKYYGTKNKFKEFIDACHKQGIAVILDIAMNQQDMPNPYLMMDFNYTTFKPNPTNKFFNVEATHPFNVFYDMNHESSYTQTYLDTINQYWLNEFKVDGFRFDLSKGFTQKNNPTDVGAWSAYDASRIALLNRMATQIRVHSPDAILILEHLSDNVEEKILAQNGFLLWGNMSYAFAQSSTGNSDGSDLAWSSHKTRGWDNSNLVAYMESHDEERMMYRNLQFGKASGSYSIKNVNTALERVKAASTFYFSIPGPKMIWQFGELGYDVSIESGGRTSMKPVKWEYYSSANRFALYNHFSEIISLKKMYSVFETNDITFSGGSNLVKQLTLRNSPYTSTPQSAEEMNAQVVVNFEVANRNVPISFPHTGVWYNYFGTSVNVTTTPFNIALAPGQYMLFTDFRIREDIVTGVDDELIDWVQVYPNPVEDVLIIQSELARVSSACIYSISGVKVWEGKVTKGSIDISNLHSGLYILDLKTSTGQYRKKILKL